MSLRARMTAWIGLVLIGCLAAGLVLTGLHTRRSVRAELAAAMEGGVRDVQAELVARPSPDPAMLARLVASFDDARHLRATLRDSTGRSVVVSTPVRPRRPAPGWFEALLAPQLAPSVVAVGGSTLTLAADDANEVDEAWVAFRDDSLVVVLFFTCAALVVYRALGRALAPLTALAARLRSISEGDTAVRAPETGAPELSGVARSFNAMATRLGESAAHAARLEAQLLTLQEEERASLARDLHDEFGPHLFAMKIDTAVIRDAAERSPLVSARIRSLDASISHIQSHVREMLERLRPAPALEGGLTEAVEAQIAFWRERRPEVTFSASVAAGDAALGGLQKTVIHRLVQEGLNNAFRHAHPSRVEILIGFADDDALTAEVRNDGAASMASGAAAGTGLTGMGERVSASGGVLTAGPSPDGQGWRVSARWPDATAAAKVLA